MIALLENLKTVDGYGGRREDNFKQVALTIHACKNYYEEIEEAFSLLLSMMKKGFHFRVDLLDATGRREENFSSQMRHWKHIRRTLNEGFRKFVSTKIVSVVAAGLKSHRVLGHLLDPIEEKYHESRNKTVFQKEIDKV